MTNDLFTEPVSTGDDLLERVAGLLGTAVRHQFWLLFIDADGRQLQTLVPIDGVPDSPGPQEALRFAPMLDWLAEGEGAHSVAFVIERPGDREFGENDLAWARVLAEAASFIELPVRGLVVMHTDGVRWLAADDYA
ncbi:hypothetical protein ACFSBZ_03215 [Amnibacterium flavum]|uniref:Uncharacterized protein n=1 Tax=Amnibacterium flavum TaxID=2173173 RepID=A0A2V1HS27_9MICO|nr:hypothetical protein [Amnibacterium flavum]PVZ94472.1 hypothetical protein DDQ50_12255 [Amnibacterium flavum]